jgi:hypothetical protein
MTQKVLRTAIHKLKPSHMPREWCAALTAAEALALIRDGYRLKKHNHYQKEDFERKIASGAGGESWCYFDKVGKTRPATASNRHNNDPQRKSFSKNS